MMKNCPTCKKRKSAKKDTVCRTCRAFITEYIDTGLLPNPANLGSYVPMVADVALTMERLGVPQDRAVIILGGNP